MIARADLDHLLGAIARRGCRLGGGGVRGGSGWGRGRGGREGGAGGRGGGGGGRRGSDLESAYLTLLVGLARNVEFAPGTFLFREGGRADRCYLLRQGKVALEIATMARGHVISRPWARGR